MSPRVALRAPDGAAEVSMVIGCESFRGGEWPSGRRGASRRSGGSATATGPAHAGRPRAGKMFPSGHEDSAGEAGTREKARGPGEAPLYWRSRITVMVKPGSTVRLAKDFDP